MLMEFFDTWPSNNNHNTNLMIGISKTIGEKTSCLGVLWNQRAVYCAYAVIIEFGESCKGCQYNFCRNAVNWLLAANEALGDWLSYSISVSTVSMVSLHRSLQCMSPRQTDLFLVLINLLFQDPLRLSVRTGTGGCQQPASSALPCCLLGCNVQDSPTCAHSHWQRCQLRTERSWTKLFFRGRIWICWHVQCQECWLGAPSAAHSKQRARCWHHTYHGHKQLQHFVGMLRTIRLAPFPFKDHWMLSKKNK